MELYCPQCDAHFNVPEGAIGPKGRKLKCAKCGHTWRQMPLGQEGAPAPAVAEPEPAPTAGPAPQPVADDGPPVPMEMEPGSRHSAEAPPAGDVPMESGRTGAEEEDDDPLAGLDFGDSDFGGLDDVDDLSRADAESAGDTDLDDLLSSDPEPIPDMFSREDDDGSDGKKKGKAGKVFLTLIVLLGIAAGGLYAGRAEVVRAFPEAEPFYAKLGIHVDALGVGLRFNDVTSERLVRDGTDTLVVRGFVANTTDTARDLPYLRLALFDATDALVQEMVAEPPQPTLDPGATTGFRVQLETPSAAARRFEVDWTEPPGGS